MRRVLKYINKSYLPLTKAYLEKIGVPNSGIIYFPNTAQEITGKAIWKQVNWFETGLRDYSLLSQCKRIFTFIGGDATSHKVEFLNPGVNDLTFYGGLTHSATGVKGNGSSGYADLNIKPRDIWGFTSNNQCALSYIRTDLAKAEKYGAFFGHYGAADQAFFLSFDENSTKTIAGVANYNIDPNRAKYVYTDKKGFWGVKKTDATHCYVLKNGVQVASGTGGGGFSANPGNFLLFTFGIGINPYADSYDVNEQAMHIDCVAMSAADDAKLYELVQDLQKGLLRAV